MAANLFNLREAVAEAVTGVIDQCVDVGAGRHQHSGLKRNRPSPHHSPPKRLVHGGASRPLGRVVSPGTQGTQHVVLQHQLTTSTAKPPRTTAPIANASAHGDEHPLPATATLSAPGAHAETPPPAPPPATTTPAPPPATRPPPLATHFGVGPAFHIPTVPAVLDGHHPISATVDTGCAVVIVTRGVVEALGKGAAIQPTTCTLQFVTSEGSAALGTVMLQVRVGWLSMTGQAIVVPQGPHGLVLGLNWLCAAKASVDLSTRTLRYRFPVSLPDGRCTECEEDTQLVGLL